MHAFLVRMVLVAVLIYPVWPVQAQVDRTYRFAIPAPAHDIEALDTAIENARKNHQLLALIRADLTVNGYGSTRCYNGSNPYKRKVYNAIGCFKNEAQIVVIDSSKSHTLSQSILAPPSLGNDDGLIYFFDPDHLQRVLYSAPMNVDRAAGKKICSTLAELRASRYGIRKGYHSKDRKKVW